MKTTRRTPTSKNKTYKNGSSATFSKAKVNGKTKWLKIGSWNPFKRKK